MERKLIFSLVLLSSMLMLMIPLSSFQAAHPIIEKHLVIKGDPANDNRIVQYDVKIMGGVTKLGPEADPIDDLIVETNITAKIYSGIIQGKDVTTDDYFFTGTLESINSSVNLIATVDDVPFSVTIVEPPPPPLGKHLEIRGDPANLINDKISYTVTISGGVTTLGLTTGIGDFVIGTNIEGITKAQAGFDEYFFTGVILSINSPVNLLVTVDGVFVPVTVDKPPILSTFLCFEIVCDDTGNCVSKNITITN